MTRHYCSALFFFFFFNDTATTEIYTLSLHDALPISDTRWPAPGVAPPHNWHGIGRRSEEHTSELQSHDNLVCRLLLEKKDKNKCSIDLRSLLSLFTRVLSPRYAE